MTSLSLGQSPFRSGKRYGLAASAAATGLRVSPHRRGKQLMPLNVGDRLGHYDVTALIGEGGMGEVYRARDTKLDRDVALKVLPQAFTDDPDRLARFEREAKVLASLNHTNIGHIYGTVVRLC